MANYDLTRIESLFQKRGGEMRPIPASLLKVELLEDRNPASTTLDFLLSGLLTVSRMDDPIVIPRTRSTPTSPPRNDNSAESLRISAILDDSPLDHPARTELRKPTVFDPEQSQTRRPERWLEEPLLSSSPQTFFPGIGVGFSEQPRHPDETTAQLKPPSRGAVMPQSSVVGTQEIVPFDDSLIGTMSAENDPQVALTAETQFIPVNANRTSNSPWQKALIDDPITPDDETRDQVGLPRVRDFNLAPMRDLTGWNGIGDPPLGPAVADPELKKLTVNVTNWFFVNALAINVTYNGGQTGKVRLWTDPTKSEEITLSGPTIHPDGSETYSGGRTNIPVEWSFYVEGVRPSQQENNIKVQVAYTPMAQPPAGAVTVLAETTVTVTPVVKEFSINPKHPAQTTFLVDGKSRIVGMNSGQQSKVGALAGSGVVGATFTADLLKTSVPGKGAFVQIVTNVVNSVYPPGVQLDNGKAGAFRLSEGRDFPISDSITSGEVPYYRSTSFVDIVLNPDRHSFADVDTPYLQADPGDAKISNFDVTFLSRLYLVCSFDDKSLYSLASSNWQIVFRATTPSGGALTVSADSIVSADRNPTYVLTNGDPDRVLGMVYNEAIQLVELIG